MHADAQGMYATLCPPPCPFRTSPSLSPTSSIFSLIRECLIYCRCELYAISCILQTALMKGACQQAVDGRETESQKPYTYTYIDPCIYTCILWYIFMCTYMYIMYTNINTYAYMYLAYVSIHIHQFMYIYKYIYIYVQVYVDIYTYIYVDTRLRPQCPPSASSITFSTYLPSFHSLRTLSHQSM